MSKDKKYGPRTREEQQVKGVKNEARVAGTTSDDVPPRTDRAQPDRKTEKRVQKQVSQEKR